MLHIAWMRRYFILFFCHCTTLHNLEQYIGYCTFWGLYEIKSFVRLRRTEKLDFIKNSKYTITYTSSLCFFILVNFKLPFTSYKCAQRYLEIIFLLLLISRWNFLRLIFPKEFRDLSIGYCTFWGLYEIKSFSRAQLGERFNFIKASKFTIT